MSVVSVLVSVVSPLVSVVSPLVSDTFHVDLLAVKSLICVELCFSMITTIDMFVHCYDVTDVCFAVSLQLCALL